MKATDNIRRLLIIIYLTITFKVFHIKDENRDGWFIKKRPIVVILAAPILIPFFMLHGVITYISWALNFDYKWIEGEKKKLTFKEKTMIKQRLSK